ncbi:hypothetical protein RBH26_20795 [Natronolimnohabitans sp. A-GB9]|uniref:hypothetical protein n=1 Tax=Natronolimnohabitans sp. A-GB9 TaxID=3069757 RepID=UPI0027B6226B|nr:hypothetical protein [Natronolimnohabitans sp. A-GB9]MDQ2052883.1 hypothetical protein [Natronolimnohabitans sp. A-GB9]
MSGNQSEKAKYQQHTHDEDLVKCPYCGEEKRSRGLYLHVYRSSDEAHGGHKDVPETWEQDKQDLEVVGQKELTLNVPTSKEYDHELLLCKYCGEKFKGTHGLSVHLSRVDDSVHPKDADLETAGIRIPVGPDLDEQRIEDVSDKFDLNLDPADFSDEKVLEREGQQTTEEPSEVPDGYIPIADLTALAAHYERRENEQAADDLRSLIEKYR